MSAIRHGERRIRTMIGLIPVVSILLHGCASSGLSPLNYGVRHLQKADSASVFDAARATLARAGYAIDRSDAAAGVIVTRPVLVDAAEARSEDPTAPGWSSSRRGRGQYRRVVEIHLSTGTDAVSVFCKVAVQEQTTEAHRMFRQDHRASDLPTETAIDREAATTTEQNVVWQTVRRDKLVERELLQAIVRQLGES